MTAPASLVVADALYPAENIRVRLRDRDSLEVFPFPVPIRNQSVRGWLGRRAQGSSSGHL